MSPFAKLPCVSMLYSICRRDCVNAFCPHVQRGKHNNINVATFVEMLMFIAIIKKTLVMRCEVTKIIGNIENLDRITKK